MFYKFEEGKDLIIDSTMDLIKKKMHSEQSTLCAEFFNQFFGTVALDDLREWSQDDLYAAVVNFWSLIEHRLCGEKKIHIYNPDYERYGWQTTHTVIEIICDDMPFLVDSLRMLLNRMGLSVYLAIHMGGLHLARDSEGHISQLFPQQGPRNPKETVEAPIFLLIDRQTDVEFLKEIQNQIASVLNETYAVVSDWELMRKQIKLSVDELVDLPKHFNAEEVEETKAFLNWLEDHHFTFLGMHDYTLVEKKDDIVLEPVNNTGLGVLRETLKQSHSLSISAMSLEARELTLSTKILIVSKTNTLATVHRNAYTDYIGIKRFNKQGKVIGERRVIGLYTSAAYNTNPKQIPFLRHKVASVIENSHLNPKGHAGKVLLNILETLPRDDLIQANEEELLEICMGIFYMQERRRIRMFARVDLYRRFISCLVYVPKERYNTEIRKEMELTLVKQFDAQSLSFSTYFSESALARIHFLFRIDPNQVHEYDFPAIEQTLIQIGRTWSDDLQSALSEAVGEEKGNYLFAKYKQAFPAVYTTNFSPRMAVLDIKYMETLSDIDSLTMNFYRPINEYEDHFRLKIYQRDVTTTLSDVLPIIENLGLRAISERPYVIKLNKGKKIWIDDFSLHYLHGCKFQLEEIKELFQNVFSKVWFNQVENDGFNQLVLAAGLDWRQVSILRMYAKYFKQIGFTFSQDYIETALSNHTRIAKQLVELFEIRFDPSCTSQRQEKYDDLVATILAALDDVLNLDEDKIIRQYVHTISETLRTNYYQIDADNKPASYLSIKLNSKSVPGVPKPHPLYEIFVCSPQFEGVHLRCAKVARGGLRWSDRKEDFRTEILGLMKAQQVKNAVIVPSGAKGGFVAKQIPANATREVILAEGIACYKLFIRGLLDITDNIEQDLIVKPKQVVCYDDDDPYLVVAADKGTATFSDIANEISLEYGFWLGDAFASGGSVGYDHKKMGITAKGAWESVKRHFYELGGDIKHTDFTVVGIGDLSGDVFGNGMLLSEHIQLVAAFNHLHIFIDPMPSPEISFAERQRLFNLPRSSWTDYDEHLISKGGGVFNRNAKSIQVSKEMQERFDINQLTIEPNELIKILLRSKVDLLWSAGIGTFVKSRSESHAEVGDRSNDLIRIDASELRCKIVGEGGNLGLTQLARVEYSLNDGQIFTDFIDNSAGVSCSDKEVNIKILLNSIVDAGDLTQKQRSQLLSEMTNEVSELVLRENYSQTRAISLIATQAMRSVELHSRYINHLEDAGKLDRSLEFLPDEKVLLERSMLGKGLSNPEISVLFCYSKMTLKADILASDVPEEAYLTQFLIASFPKPLQERFSQQMEDHRLKREIIATKISNMIVNEMGFSFIYRLVDETGASSASAVRAYLIARSVLGMDLIWPQIEALDGVIDSKYQIEVMMVYLRLLRRLSRWLLSNQRIRLDISQSVEHYAPGIVALKKSMPDCLGKQHHRQYDATLIEYQEKGIPDSLAHELCSTPALFAAMDIIEIAHELNQSIDNVAAAYFGIGEFLDLAWFRFKIIVHPSDNHWEALSREALRDDLDWQQRKLVRAIMGNKQGNQEFSHCLTHWSEMNAPLIQRWRDVLSNLRSSSALNYTMFYVAIRDLVDLTQTSLQEACAK